MLFSIDSVILILSVQYMTEIMTYSLLDTGDGSKLERFGDYILSRPCSQAVWVKERPALWKEANAVFTREGENQWSKKGLYQRAGSLSFTASD